MNSAQKIKSLADKLVSESNYWAYSPTVQEVAVELRLYANLLSRLEKAERQLKEAEWLLDRCIAPMEMPYPEMLDCVKRRNAFLAELRKERAT